uniref:MCM7 factor n=1 Tax=Cyanistes caeruleus TaxID=156563 RepID=A0A8C0VER4_CYACU
ILGCFWLFSGVIWVYFPPRCPRPSEAIFGLLRELGGRGRQLPLPHALQVLGARGFTPGQVRAALAEYQALDVLQVNHNHITFV